MDLQSERDSLINNLILLYIINDAQEKSHNYLGMTKLQKFVFLVEKNLNENRMRALTYDFFMWDYGPLSKEIYVDYKILKQNDICIQSDNVSLSKRGKYLVTNFQDVFEENREVLNIIDDVINQFASYDTDSIVQYVHNIEIMIEGCDEPIQIENIEKGIDLITGLSDQDSSLSFTIDESWLETLDILLDKELCESIDRSEQEIRNGKVFQLHEVL